MHRLVGKVEFHHNHLSAFVSSLATRALRSHPTVRSLGAVSPTINLNHTQSLHFSAYSNPKRHRYQQQQQEQLNSGYMGLEPDMSNSSSGGSSAAGAAEGEGGGGGGGGAEDIVHDLRVADGINYEEESVVDGERSADESHEWVTVSGVGGEEGEREKKLLPDELASSVMKLTCDSTAEGGVCDVYLVGTAHVSSESCQQVQAVISFLKPQVVFLELCSSRVSVLQPQNLKVPTVGEMVMMWKKNHNLFGILYGWFLAKVASKLEVLPGAEFRVAFEEAIKYGGKVVLGDRPVEITLRRTWAKMPLWHKTKLISSLLFQAVTFPSPEDLSKMLKEMDDVDMLTLVIQEMSKQFPTLMETLVHERDKYMSSSLLRVASEHNLVVAVVGKGHLPGIKHHWTEPIELKELLTEPTPKPAISVGKILTTVGVAVAGVVIVSGIYLSSKK